MYFTCSGSFCKTALQCSTLLLLLLIFCGDAGFTKIVRNGNCCNSIPEFYKKGHCVWDVFEKFRKVSEISLKVCYIKAIYDKGTSNVSKVR